MTCMGAEPTRPSLAGVGEIGKASFGVSNSDKPTFVH